MNQPTKQEIRLMLYGAIRLYEQECLDIPSVLRQQGRPDLADHYDTLGAALYWLQQNINLEDDNIDSHNK